MRLVFMGSPQFAVPSLQRLLDSDHDVAAVVCQPDRPAGRGRRVRQPPTKELALARGLPVLQPERVNRPEALAAIRDAQPDALIIAAFGQILRQPLLDIPKRGSLNVHASLLPKYRGAAPIAAAVLAGDEETGVSIMEVVLALDAGPVVARRAMPIAPDDTTATLTERLSHLGADLLIEVLPGWANGALTPETQDEARATYAPPIKREDALIDWSRPAVEVWRRVRAYNPWPVATTSVNGEPLRIWAARPLVEEAAVTAGTAYALPGAGFAVRSGQGAVEVLLAQRAGRRVVTGEELLRGWRDLLGKRLGS